MTLYGPHTHQYRRMVLQGLGRRGLSREASLQPANRIPGRIFRHDPEINTSFYVTLKPAVGKQWCRAAAGNANFLFTAKLNRAFTHSPAAQLEATSAATIQPKPTDEDDAKAGFDAIAGEGKLGAVLAQFPISFKNDEKNCAATLRSSRRSSVSISWYSRCIRQLE